MMRNQVRVDTQSLTRTSATAFACDCGTLPPAGARLAFRIEGVLLMLNDKPQDWADRLRP